MFICYASAHGHALLDSRLYLPQGWFEPAYAERFQRCQIPQDITFQTKPQLAAELLQRLLGEKRFAGQWITCDCSFGNNEAFLEALPKDFYYLAEIACTRKVWVVKAKGHPKLEKQGGTVESLTAVRALLHGETHKVAEGETGPIVAGFARVRVHLSAERTAESERWLVLRNDYPIVNAVSKSLKSGKPSTYRCSVNPTHTVHPMVCHFSRKNGDIRFGNPPVGDAPAGCECIPEPAQHASG